MTKLRTPDSLEDACHMAVGFLGVQAIAEAMHAQHMAASASLITKWGDPDSPQTPNFRQVLVMEALLLKAGFQPVFSELMRPDVLAPTTAAPTATPIEAAMQHTIESAELLKGVRSAVKDGRLEAAEIAMLKPMISRLQRALAELNRSLVVKRKP